MEEYGQCFNLPWTDIQWKHPPHTPKATVAVTYIMFDFPLRCITNAYCVTHMYLVSPHIFWWWKTSSSSSSGAKPRAFSHFCSVKFLFCCENEERKHPRLLKNRYTFLCMCLCLCVGECQCVERCACQFIFAVYLILVFFFIQFYNIPIKLTLKLRSVINYFGELVRGLEKLIAKISSNLFYAYKSNKSEAHVCLFGNFYFQLKSNLLRLFFYF